jgi:type I site-specific restriction endonuclease
MDELSAIHAKYRFLQQDYSDLRLSHAQVEAQLQRLFREHLEMTKRVSQTQTERDVAARQAQESEARLRDEIMENTRMKADLAVARGENVRLAAELLRYQARDTVNLASLNEGQPG